MLHQFRLILFFLTLSFLVTGSSAMAGVRPEWRVSLLDDATLNDVTFVGKTGWAVGEHGVIRRTTDGGLTWSLEQSPRPASLQSVCFLTNHIGWVAGGFIEPYTQAERGVLFATNDGGQTWQDLTTADLPFLHKVKFFSLEFGVAVAGKMGPYGSGLLSTEDGGESWLDTSSQAEIRSAWRTGDFVSPTRGVIVGRRGALSTWGGNEFSAAQQLSFGRSHLQDVQLDPNGTGWLVGDQALLMKSPNSGVTWESPPGKLPPELRDVVDFLAVEQRGDKVWVAGKPGTVIWHSADAGQTWKQQVTKSNTPLRAIHFRDDQFGIAIGDLGTILLTDDGGQTWNNQRLERPRRAGMMLISSSPESLSFPLISWYAGENGYRSIALIPVQQDMNRDLLQTDLRLSSAFHSVGGNAAYAGHRLPVGLPDLTTNREQLIAEWNARTDGRLQQVLLGGLVAEIRQWRPEVIVLDHAAEDDQATQLLNLAVNQAVKESADETRHLELSQNLGLLPWQVSRVVTLQPAAGPSGAFFSPDRSLVRLGMTLGESTDQSISRLNNEVTPQNHGAMQVNGSEERLQLSELFRDLRLDTGGDARRRMIPLTADMVEEDNPNPKHARQIQNMALRARKQFGSAESLIGLLPKQLEGMDPEAAARMLLSMGEQALSMGDMTAAEGIWIELVNNYEATLAGQQGMQKLIQFWASEEIAWHRSRQIGSSHISVSTNEDSVLQALGNPTEVKLSSNIYELGNESKQKISRSPIVQASSLENSPQDWHSGVRDRWLRQAGFLGIVLSQRNPALLRDETIQRSLAVINRHPEIAGEMDELFQKTHHLPRDVPTNWYIPPREPSVKKSLSAIMTSSRPHLDGIFDDECWKSADAEVLQQGSGRVYAEGASFIKMAYDKEYLYIAASLVQHPAVILQGTQLAGRHHDAKLTGHDRITFALDIDRESEFYYELTIDERGWTSESLGGFPVWNPNMFIATHHERGHWRIEAAIPLKELAPPAKVPGHSWGLAIRRTLPMIGWESWQSGVTTDHPTVDEFGRLQFK
ncbi:MAG: YCF48-related protein [Planctomycetaceae bacterium]|jgi:photosystem II stability/assembly factor-like uncharacterized protein|nr:YCF48-related protein [Planctomycetaceae bacterium]MDG2388604.1 YCF48-related protein [Planctomycetaceae bacterium]